MNIELVGKFFDNQSLSKVNRNIVKAIHNNISITALDSPMAENKVDNIDYFLSRKGKQPLTGDYIIQHSYPPIFRWPENKESKVIYIQPWEFADVPSEWQYKFQEYADALIVPSNFVREAFLTAGLDPDKVFVIPNGYDPDIYFAEEREDKEFKRFLFVGCGQFRKGFDVLLKAWVHATNKTDNIELIIKDTPQVYGDTQILENITRTQYSTDCAKITYIDDIYSEREMADLYRSTDVIVHPYRGEGFGMHIMEAMACGVFPLVTKGGATDDFVIESDSKISSYSRPVNMYDIFALKPGDSMSAMGKHRTILEPDINELVTRIKELKVSKIRVPDVSRIKSWTEVGKMYTSVLSSLEGPPVRVRNKHNGSN